MATSDRPPPLLVILQRWKSHSEVAFACITHTYLLLNILRLFSLFTVILSISLLFLCFFGALSRWLWHRSSTVLVLIRSLFGNCSTCPFLYVHNDRIKFCQLINRNIRQHASTYIVVIHQEPHTQQSPISHEQEKGS